MMICRFSIFKPNHILFAVCACVLYASPTHAHQQSAGSEQYQAGHNQQQAYIAEIDSVLAPIALYPDTLLSHILIASSEPLSLLQAASWRKQHRYLSDDALHRAAENKSWSPSVKALLPFDDLLEQLTQDLNWLENLGTIYLDDETLLLSRVQYLRLQAKSQGNLSSNDRIIVVEEEEDIIIRPRHTHVVYVPYYDPVTVYGHWWHHHHHPVVWYPRYSHVGYNGISWSVGILLHHGFHISHVRWRHRHVVISRHYRKPYSFHKVVVNREQQRGNGYKRYVHPRKRNYAQRQSSLLKKTYTAHKQTQAVQTLRKKTTTLNKPKYHNHTTRKLSSQNTRVTTKPSKSVTKDFANKPKARNEQTYKVRKYKQPRLNSTKVKTPHRKKAKAHDHR